MDVDVGGTVLSAVWSSGFWRVLCLAFGPSAFGCHRTAAHHPGLLAPARACLRGGLATRQSTTCFCGRWPWQEPSPSFPNHPPWGVDVGRSLKVHHTRLEWTPAAPLRCATLWHKPSAQGRVHMRRAALPPRTRLASASRGAKAEAACPRVPGTGAWQASPVTLTRPLAEAVRALRGPAIASVTALWALILLLWPLGRPRIEIAASSRLKGRDVAGGALFLGPSHSARRGGFRNTWCLR